MGQLDSEVNRWNKGGPPGRAVPPPAQTSVATDLIHHLTNFIRHVDARFGSQPLNG